MPNTCRFRSLIFGSKTILSLLTPKPNETHLNARDVRIELPAVAEEPFWLGEHAPRSPNLRGGIVCIHPYNEVVGISR